MNAFPNVNAARDQSGATSIEYALIAGAISIAIIGAVTLIGKETRSSLEAAADGFVAKSE